MNKETVSNKKINKTAQEVRYVYHTAGLWQIGFFALNNAAANAYIAMMGYVSYYANGIVGLGVVLVSFVLTALNIFDGIADPIVGFFLDKTEGRFGKFRPYMVIGNLLMLTSCLILFFTTHLLYLELRLPYFILLYAIFIIGYTFQTVVTKSGQTILTNHPNQRPVSTYFDSLFTMAVFGGIALFVSNYLVPKYGGFQNKELFFEFIVWVGVTGLLCTALAVIGIWHKDRIEYFGNQKKQKKVMIRDYWEITRHNKPIRTLVLAASINKFTASIYSNTTVGVMLFGILIQDYSVSGVIGIVTAVPTLAVITLGIKVAQSFGQKISYIIFTWAGMIFQVMMLLLFIFDDLTLIRFRFGYMNRTTVLFFIIFVLLNGCKSITNNMVVPMIADCSDYEIYRTGKFVPGLMGALFSFADKIFSALGTIFVGLVVAFSGFGKVFPQISDKETPVLKWATIFMYCIIPIIGWMISLIFMKSYELDKKKMKEIHRCPSK